MNTFVSIYVSNIYLFVFNCVLIYYLCHKLSIFLLYIAQVILYLSLSLFCQPSLIASFPIYQCVQSDLSIHPSIYRCPLYRSTVVSGGVTFKVNLIEQELT